MRYTRDQWKRLGDAVHIARMKNPEWRDIIEWARAVDRSTRVVYGLERGEPVGMETVTRIERLLRWPPDYTISLLTDPKTPSVPPKHDATELGGTG